VYVLVQCASAANCLYVQAVATTAYGDELQHYEHRLIAHCQYCCYSSSSSSSTLAVAVVQQRYNRSTATVQAGSCCLHILHAIVLTISSSWRSALLHSPLQLQVVLLDCVANVVVRCELHTTMSTAKKAHMIKLTVSIKALRLS
jgi:hypothetical protein